MNQQRLQALLARVKTANDEKEGLLARARAYARRNPAAAGAAGAGGTAALLAALFSRRGNRLRNALLAGGLGAGAGYGAGRWYPGAVDRDPAVMKAQEDANREHWERMNEEDRQRAEQAAIDARVDAERKAEEERQREHQNLLDSDDERLRADEMEWERQAAEEARLQQAAIEAARTERERQKAVLQAEMDAVRKSNTPARNLVSGIGSTIAADSKAVMDHISDIGAALGGVFAGNRNISRMNKDRKAFQDQQRKLRAAEIVARQKPAPPTGAGLPPRLTGVQEPNPFTQYAPPAITGKRRTGGRSRDELERQMEEIRSRTDTQGLTMGRDALDYLLRRRPAEKARGVSGLIGDLRDLHGKSIDDRLNLERMQRERRPFLERQAAQKAREEAARQEAARLQAEVRRQQDRAVQGQSRSRQGNIEAWARRQEAENKARREAARDKTSLGGRWTDSLLRRIFSNR